MHTTTQRTPSHIADQIACLAYRLWEQAGRPNGLDMDFWFKAEQQLATAAKPTTDSNGQLPTKSSSMPSTITYRLKSQPKSEYAEKAAINATTRLDATQKRTAPAARTR